MSFTIDGAAVVLGPEGLSRFDELRPTGGLREPGSSMPSTSSSTMAKILCNLAFLDRKAALASG